MSPKVLIKILLLKPSHPKIRFSFIFIIISLCFQVSAQSSLKKVELFLYHADEIKGVWPGFINQFHHAIYDKNGKVYLALEGNKPSGWELEKTFNSVPVFFK
jgi:hypothetical protein